LIPFCLSITRSRVPSSSPFFSFMDDEIL
jgi:hypothetical protein